MHAVCVVSSLTTAVFSCLRASFLHALFLASTLSPPFISCLRSIKATEQESMISARIASQHIQVRVQSFLYVPCVSDDLTRNGQCNVLLSLFLCLFLCLFVCLFLLLHDHFFSHCKNKLINFSRYPDLCMSCLSCLAGHNDYTTD